jgi:hypothetical protein
MNSLKPSKGHCLTLPVPSWRRGVWFKPGLRYVKVHQRASSQHRHSLKLNRSPIRRSKVITIRIPSQLASNLPGVSDTACRLLALPVEIRLRIYDFVFNQKTVVLGSDKTCGFQRYYATSNANAGTPKKLFFQHDPEAPEETPASPHALIQTCRQIYQEAVPYTKGGYELTCCSHVYEAAISACSRFTEAWRNRFGKLSILLCNSGGGGLQLGVHLPSVRLLEFRFVMSDSVHSWSHVPARMPRSADRAPDIHLQRRAQRRAARLLRRTIESCLAPGYRRGDIICAPDVNVIAKAQIHGLHYESSDQIRNMVSVLSTRLSVTRTDICKSMVWDHRAKEFIQWEILNSPLNVEWIYD